MVKVYPATLGRAFEILDIKVDLPALGNPIIPTSASSLSSKKSWQDSPGFPVLIFLGARLVADLKRILV